MKERAFSRVFSYNGFHMVSPGKSGKIEGSQEERFLKAFEEYGDALFRHAYIRISDRERAIDLVHDTYTKVWSYLRTGHEIESFRPFLYKVLNNLVIDEYRRRKEASLDAILGTEGVSEGTFDDLIDDSVESLAATLDGRRAFDLLETLPREYREVVTLRFVDGLGPKEISELIEESENVVSVRLHRALKLLRRATDNQNQKGRDNLDNTT
ncbi:MAG: RNA polymerase sigma factor [Candidatus Paceibacterota bacterium]